MFSPLPRRRNAPKNRPWTFPLGQALIIAFSFALPGAVLAEKASPSSIPMENPSHLQVTARSLGYTWSLLEVRSHENTTLILSELKAPGGDMMVGMALEELTLTFPLPDGTRPRHFVLGSPTGLFEPPGELTFLSSRKELPDDWEEAETIWKAPAQDTTPDH